MHVRIKICGITTSTDAIQAAVFGADAVGLNFYPESPRYIESGMAYLILDRLPPFVEPVALFVNKPLTLAQQEARSFGIRTVQIHADDHELLPPGSTRWIPAFSVHEAADLERITSYLDKLLERAIIPTAILVDAKVSGKHGGTGQVAPWHLLAHFKPGVPLILAGGLTPENVAEAIRIVRPYGVDVASGVESAPGVKDSDKMRHFIDAVRAFD